MQPKIILGYSENVLSMVLETLRASGEKGPYQIWQNILPVQNDKIPFVPPGFEVSVTFAGEKLNLSPANQYLFGVLTPGIKCVVFDFFYKNFGITREKYINLVHPSSSVASTAKMKGGCYVEPSVVLSPFSMLGFGVTINRGATIGHHTLIDDFVTINPGANIAGHVNIGENTSVGIGSAVFDHIHIGKNCKIGGGSVVTKDIPDNVIAWGNPCKIIKKNEV